MILKREPWNTDIRYGLHHALLAGFQISVSVLTVMNMEYVLSRRKIMASSWYPDLISFADILNISALMVDFAMKSQWADIEDALQYRCAKENNAEIILSRDKSGFKNSSIPVLTPIQLRKLFE